jgi:threonyl-tRNA synthetase
VIIHRAILGSVERMVAILTESTAGKWPFWISPRQCIVVPVGPQFDEYGEEVNLFFFFQDIFIHLTLHLSPF